MPVCWSCAAEIPDEGIRERPIEHPESVIRKTLPGAQPRMGYGRCPSCREAFYVFFNGRDEAWLQPDMIPLLEDAFPPGRQDRAARRKRDWIRERDAEMRAFFSPGPRRRRGTAGGASSGATWEERRDPTDPWRILGLRRGASREAAEKAFRRRAKECHPDRVARMDEEIRELAHVKVLELKEALDAVLKEMEEP